MGKQFVLRVPVLEAPDKMIEGTAACWRPEAPSYDEIGNSEASFSVTRVEQAGLSWQVSLYSSKIEREPTLGSSSVMA